MSTLAASLTGLPWSLLSVCAKNSASLSINSAIRNSIAERFSDGNLDQESNAFSAAATEFALHGDHAGEAIGSGGRTTQGAGHSGAAE